MFGKIVVGASICIACILGSLNSAASATRIALVIGNANYETAPLKNPVNDARDMAEALRALDFEVILKLDADQRQMELAIDEFYGRLRRMEVGVFYFAGHGMQVDGDNYLIPIKAHVTSETDIRWEAVPAGKVLGKMNEAGNKLNIAILDACRDNPFKRSFRSQGKGLAFMDAPKGTIIAYATSPGSVAADGAGRNGIYTKHLLENLNSPGMSVYDVFRETGLGVMRETDDKQVPWISSTPIPRYFLSKTDTEADETEKRRLEQDRARIDTDRRELEQMRADLEKKKRESEPQKVETSSYSPEPSYSRPQSSDSGAIEGYGDYEVYANGIVKDTKTGLEWISGSDKEIKLPQANSWVQNLTVDGGNWRLPKPNELAKLYVDNKATRNIIPLLKGKSGWRVWTGKKSGEFCTYYSFHNNQWEACFSRICGCTARVIAVRDSRN